MDTTTTSNEVAHDFAPWFRIYKDGHVHRYIPTNFVSPSDDPNTNTTVRSKDVVVSPQTNLSARLYLPKTTTNSTHKLPLLIYIHGGAFSIESPFSATYHNFLNSVVEAANVVAISIDYRLAPEHPIPACYDDSWTVMNWVALHAKDGQGPDPWLNDHADFTRVFFAGDSAGANIAHNMVVRSSVDGLEFGVIKIVGIVLIHPFFGSTHTQDKLWVFICPESSGINDPRLNPAAHPALLAKLVCNKVLVCTAEKDVLRKRGWTYYEALRSSAWGGVVEIVDTEGEGHVFHLFDPTSQKAGALIKRVASFINQDQVPSLL